MSTKIYNAYKFNGTIEQLMDHITEYRGKWLEFQAKRLNNLIQNCWDTDAAAKKDLFNEDGSVRYHELEEAIRKDSTKPFKSWGDLFDVSGSVMVYFYKKNIYVQTFLQTETFDGVKPPMFVTKQMVDFHYQDQSDPSYCFEKGYEKWTAAKKAAAAKDWKNRQKVWDALFETNHSFAYAGLIAEMISNTDYYTVTHKIAAMRRKPKKEQA